MCHRCYSKHSFYLQPTACLSFLTLLCPTSPTQATFQFLICWISACFFIRASVSPVVGSLALELNYLVITARSQLLSSESFCTKINRILPMYFIGWCAEYLDSVSVSPFSGHLQNFGRLVFHTGLNI